MAYTLDNLRTDIRNYTEVDSGVLSDTILDTIIKNAENRIYRDADSDDNRFYATSSLVTGNRYVTIPSDLRFIRYVQLKNSSGDQRFLEKRDTSFMSEYYDTPATQSGFPKYYGNWDAEFWVVAPTPDSTYEITLAYVKQPISITNTTTPSAAPAATAGTYISNKYQDLLLYGCLVEAYGYLKGPADMLQYYEGSFRRALQSYAIEQQGRRRRDEYQDGAIRTPLKSESPSKY
jgi:hypothetical protein